MEDKIPDLDFGSQTRFSRKTILSAVAVILLLISIPLGVYLVGQKQIFRPKAFEKKFQDNRKLTGNVNLVSSWTQIPAQRFLNGQKMVLANGYIVSLGDIDKAGHTTLVSTAKINKEDSLDNFKAGSALPVGLSDFAVTSLGSHIFVLGGKSNLQEQAAVFINKIDSNGLLDKWKVSTPLPKSLSDLSVVISGKYIYAIGGKNKNADQNIVYAAKINPDGTLGNWKVISTLPKALSSPAAAVYTNYLVIGGGKSDNLDQAEIYAAGIKPDGTLNSWSKVSSFPKALSKLSLLASSGYLLAIGGENTGKPQPEVYFTSLNVGSDKIALSSWSLASPLPAGFIFSSAASFNNLIMVMGQARAGNEAQLLIGKTEPPSFIYPKKTITDQTQEVKVLDLRYYPLDPGTVDWPDPMLDPLETGLHYSLSYIRTETDTLQTSTAQNMNVASKYHGYKTEASPYLSFSVITSKEFLKPLPPSKYCGGDICRPDYRKILTEDINICDYVDNQGVSEVWLWGYHYGDLAPVESNMAMGNISKQFWNYGTYGDISNDWMHADDLPTCNNTYTLYNYNYAAGEGNALENHTHQLESLFNYLGYPLPESFYHPTGLQEAVNRCGWTHYPPNMPDPGPGYIWNSENIVKSDCQDWKAEGFGEALDTSCHSWYGDTCLDDGGIGFKVWWMQSIPGLGNNLTYQGYKMRNWWEFYGNLDEALKNGRYLYDRPNPTPTPTPTPTPPPPTPYPGDFLSQWTSTTPLPLPNDPSVVETVGNYIYFLGAYAKPNVYYAQANSDGTIPEWIRTNDLPIDFWPNSSVTDGKYLFALGNYSDLVYINQPNLSDGTLGPWIAGRLLPVKLGAYASVVANSYLYVIGGSLDFHDQSAVYYSKIASDGTLGPWKQSAINLPKELSSHTASVYDNKYIYIIGGRSNSALQSTIYMAQVNPSDGSLTPWQTLNKTPLPTLLSNHRTAVYGKNVVVMGGLNSPYNTTDKVYYTQINWDGIITPWGTTTSLPKPMDNFGAISLGGYIFILGGSNVSGFQKDVYSSYSQYVITPTPIPTPTPTPTPIPIPKACLAVITSARNSQTGECKQFPNSCLPEGWVLDPGCNLTTPR